MFALVPCVLFFSDAFGHEIVPRFTLASSEHESAPAVLGRGRLVLFLFHCALGAGGLMAPVCPHIPLTHNTSGKNDR